MGLTFTDILIKNHSHRNILKYLHNNSFQELFDKDYEGTHFNWTFETFPKQKKSGIDKHEICTWKSGDHQSSIILESNKKTPWVRLQFNTCDFSEDDLINTFNKLSPDAVISSFTYNSVSDSAYIYIYKSKKCFFIFWDCEKDQISVNNYSSKQTDIYTLEKELAHNTCGENIVYYFWKALYDKIPIRYNLIEPKEKLIEYLKQIDINL